MKSKTEIGLDKEFERMGVKPRIYHFIENTYPYRAVTVVMDNRDLLAPLLWKQVLARVISGIDYASVSNYNRTTRVIKQLKTENIHGIAICDIRDQFNRKQGRIIAKGRLLKQLKRNE